MPRPRLAVPLVLAGLLLACATSEPSRDLHQWTDADGNVHYTPYPERVPPDQTHTLVVVERTARRTPRFVPAPAPRPLPESGDAAGTEPGTETAAARVEAAHPPPVPHPLDGRIADLEARVAADEETLKALISDPEKAPTLRGSPEVREIGERLPGMQAELARLLAEREATR